MGFPLTLQAVLPCPSCSLLQPFQVPGMPSDVKKHLKRHLIRRLENSSYAEKNVDLFSQLAPEAFKIAQPRLPLTARNTAWCPGTLGPASDSSTLGPDLTSITTRAPNSPATQGDPNPRPQAPQPAPLPAQGHPHPPVPQSRGPPPSSPQAWRAAASSDLMYPQGEAQETAQGCRYP